MEDRENNELPIKCLSICGGGHNGFSSIAILKEAYEVLWDYNSIKSIFCTSSGGVVALVIGLKQNVDHVVQYALDRPLDNIISFDSSRIISLLYDNGMYGKEIFIDFFKPLFASADLDINITLKDFYEYSQIDINFFTTEAKKCESVMVSYKSHPDLPIIDAVIMSASIPIIFKPICIDDKYYFDGGLFKSSPHPDALLFYNSSEVLTICERCHLDENYNNDNDTEKITLSNFFMIMVSNLMKKFNIEYAKNFVETPTTFIMESKTLTYTTLYNCKNTEYRKELYEYGVSLYKKKLITNSSHDETL